MYSLNSVLQSVQLKIQAYDYSSTCSLGTRNVPYATEIGQINVLDFDKYWGGGFVLHFVNKVTVPNKTVLYLN